MGQNSKPSTTYSVESSKSFTSLSCVDKCLNKMLDCRCVIGILCIIFCIIIIAVVAVTIAVVIAYEVEDSSNFEDCEMVNYKNVYYCKSGDINNFCLEYYNISKIFNIGNDIDIVADCTFEIEEEDDQLVLNKFNQTNTIIDNWVKSYLNVLVTDKRANSAPTVLFAYLLSIGYSYDDAYALLKKINDIDISYNFMQQIKMYAYTLETGTSLTVDEFSLLWSNTNNIIVCMDA